MILTRETIDGIARADGRVHRDLIDTARAYHDAQAEVERLRAEAATGPSWNAVALRSALVAMTVERDDLRAAHERLDRDARAVAGRSLHYEALAEATRLADEVERLRRIERAEVADLKFDVERLEKAVDVLAASVNAATIRAEKAEAAIDRVRALHNPRPTGPKPEYLDRCDWCHDPYPCATIRALDGDT